MRTLSSENIEVVFLQRLLRITLLLMLIIIAVDCAVSGVNSIDVRIDIGIIVAVLSAWAIERYSYIVAVCFVTLPVMGIITFFAMHRFSALSITLVTILAVGFLFSILTIGWFRLFLHGISMVCLLLVSIAQIYNPTKAHALPAADLLPFILASIAVYIIITYTAAVLKTRYRTVHKALQVAYGDLVQQKEAVALQNMELQAHREELRMINLHLEELVEVRTQELTNRKSKILQYANTNAHKVRGPIARILGLIYIAQSDISFDKNLIFEYIRRETEELDTIIQQINNELEQGDAVDLSTLPTNFWLK